VINLSSYLITTKNNDKGIGFYMIICIEMMMSNGFKKITIKEELYRKLINLRKPSQSISDVIGELLLKNRKDPLAHFGIGKDLNPQDIDDFENILVKNRAQNQELHDRKRNTSK